MVVEWEQELWEEEEVISTFEHRCSELSSHEANLDTRKTALEVDQKSLGDLHAEVLAHELTAELKTSHLGCPRSLGGCGSSEWHERRRAQE
jgi:hypothetical protein